MAGAGWALLDLVLIASGAVVAVMASALPYSLEIFALRQLPRQTFGVLLSLEPAGRHAAGVPGRRLISGRAATEKRHASADDDGSAARSR